MKAFLKRVTIWTAIGGIGLLSAGALCYASGARVNTSKSIPVGLYWTSDHALKKGEYVMFCPPRVGVMAEAKRRGYLTAGLCPGRYGYMMKRVLAAKGDIVSIKDDGVRVNGKLLPLSAPLPYDPAGRPLPRYQSKDFVIGNSELLLMSDVSGKSFDGRYFGPIGRGQIRSVIVPVLTW